MQDSHISGTNPQNSKELTLQECKQARNLWRYARNTGVELEQNFQQLTEQDLYSSPFFLAKLDRRGEEEVTTNATLSESSKLEVQGKNYLFKIKKNYSNATCLRIVFALFSNTRSKQTSPCHRFWLSRLCRFPWTSSRHTQVPPCPHAHNGVKCTHTRLEPLSPSKTSHPVKMLGGDRARISTRWSRQPHSPKVG